MVLTFFLEVSQSPLGGPPNFPFQKKKMQAVNEEMSLKIRFVLFVALSQSEERKYFFGNRC